MIQIVGAPFDLCGKRIGSRLGPIAIRLCGLVPGLERLGHKVSDAGAMAALDASAPADIADRHARANATYAEVKQHVSAAIARGDTPVVLGGDHSVSLGSVAGALDSLGSQLAVLWIDAHVDLNTPDTSPSGNLHGMPLAALTGLGTKATGEMGRQWAHLTGELVGEPKLDPAKLSWLGLRDVDRGEVENLSRVPGALPLTMQDVDELGAKGALERALAHLEANGAKAVWVSFDVDCLDPVFAPGTGTAVRGGFTYREGHLIAETLFSYFKDGRTKLAGLDVVEVNPLADTNNDTANVAVEWILSFFGKTILHSEDPGRTER